MTGWFMALALIISAWGTRVESEGVTAEWKWNPYGNEYRVEITMPETVALTVYPNTIEGRKQEVRDAAAAYFPAWQVEYIVRLTGCESGYRWEPWVRSAVFWYDGRYLQYYGLGQWDVPPGGVVSNRWGYVPPDIWGQVEKLWNDTKGGHDFSPWPTCRYV